MAACEDGLKIPCISEGNATLGNPSENNERRLQ